MPTEEIFTTPDCRRAEGTILSSLPLVLNGQVIRGLQLTLEDGRVVGVDAEQGADLVRGQLATMENADRLGELALVTSESRVGQDVPTVHYSRHRQGDQHGREGQASPWVRSWHEPAKWPQLSPLVTVDDTP